MSIATEYAERGYAIVRGLFTAAEVAEIGGAMDAVHAEGLAHGRSFRHGNLFYRVVDGVAGAEVRLVQWPSWHNEVLGRTRVDARFHALLSPFLGDDIKQIINQLHWKRPGGQGDFAWHQDSRFRRPADAYRGLGANYVQTGLAIDPHDAASGGMRIVPGSHKAGDLKLEIAGAVMDAAAADEALIAAGFDPADVIDLELQPGDLALWSPYLVHGSGQNRAGHMRRFYINGYVRADACDRGEWAFRGGEPVLLSGRPALVHYEELHRRPEPHYVD
jgi:ectoine hydroxylase-related dioxygenase (phytanoyl-CoA dioxygenase family)